MLPNFLVPESVVRTGGTSPALEIAVPGEVLILTLGINRSVEQESLDVLVYGSSDGASWGAKPLMRFPQKFYCGTYTMLLDLSSSPEIRYLRAEYKMNRWGRGGSEPLFGFYLFVESAAHRALTEPVASTASAVA